MQPVAHIEYQYDAVGNRISKKDNYGTTRYTYDANDRLLSAGAQKHAYDANGNMVSRETRYGTVLYSYTPDNQLSQVSYPDETYVKYQYNALGHKIFREAKVWDVRKLEKQEKNEKPKENNGNAYGHDKQENRCQGFENSQGQGQSNNDHQSDKGQGNGKSTGKGPINTDQHGTVKPNLPAVVQGSDQTGHNFQLKLRVSQSRYFYDGNDVLDEFTGKGDPLAQYDRVNGQVTARKMFGLHNLNDEGYIGAKLHTRGGQLFYHYDGTENVTDITDHTGRQVAEYSYEAFGGLFTDTWAPYNSVGLSGKTYDPKASLMDFSARWYSPVNGRFTSRDTYRGVYDMPATLNRYVHAGNNPLIHKDLTGNYWWCQYGEWSHEPPCDDPGHLVDIPDPSDSPDDYYVPEPSLPTQAERISLADGVFSHFAGAAPDDDPIIDRIWEGVKNYPLEVPRAQLKAASIGLDGLGLPITAQTFAHTLQAHPSDLFYDRDPDLSNNIYQNLDFKIMVNDYFKQAKNSGSSSFTGFGTSAFERANGLDLFAAIHNYRYEIHGQQDDLRRWHTNILITDKIDYDNMPQHTIAQMFKEYDILRGAFWEANDIAFLMQKGGVIVPYDVSIYLQN